MDEEQKEKALREENEGKRGKMRGGRVGVRAQEDEWGRESGEGEVKVEE